MTTRDELIEDQARFQPWRSDKDTEWLVDYMLREGDRPYCRACHDWHNPDEEHSTFTESGAL